MRTTSLHDQSGGMKRVDNGNPINGKTNMIGSMKLINYYSGLMECQVCHHVHHASFQPGRERADGVTRFYRGSWQCSNENCPTQEEFWDEQKQRFAKQNWRALVTA
jgi:hypothetical protein